jgi:hypothetical protein
MDQEEREETEEVVKEKAGEGGFPLPGSGVEQLDAHAEAEVRQVLATLDDVVTEAGEDFHYERTGGTCYYIRDGQPDCLAARVLARLGMSTEALSHYENRACDSMGVFFPASHPLAPPVDAAALYTLRAAQWLQDKEHTWGECRDNAHKWAKDCYGIEA